MPPPMSESRTASSKNCRAMSSLRAPIDLRRPISRVRSVTETSMMFMMPMPATTSATPPIAVSPLAMTPSTVLKVCSVRQYCLG